MDLTNWLSLLAVCALGAMSPGPSLGIIIQVTARQGRWHGVLAALAHGAGVGLYALLTALGLSVLITESPGLFIAIKILGALFLLYLGIGMLREKPDPSGDAVYEKSVGSSAAVGFFTAVLNPKLILFFLALFSQFVRNEADLFEKLLMAITASAVDALWYVIVAVVASNAMVAKRFSRWSTIVKSVFAGLLIFVSLQVFVAMI